MLSNQRRRLSNAALSLPFSHHPSADRPLTVAVVLEAEGSQAMQKPSSVRNGLVMPLADDRYDLCAQHLRARATLCKGPQVGQREGRAAIVRTQAALIIGRSPSNS